MIQPSQPVGTPLIPTSEAAIWRYLAEDPDYVALCHWNANVDNAWFWRHPDGHLDCGLLDWGCVGQMNLAMVLWGAMCSAETDMWNQHFEALLDHFVAEFRAAGGPLMQVATVKRHLLLYVAVIAFVRVDISTPLPSFAQVLGMSYSARITVTLSSPPC